jgi:hypothetical protein
LVTVTFTGPPTLSWAAGIVMVIVVPPFDAVPPVSPLPPKFTIDPAMKPVPVKVMFTDWPATPLVGLMEVSVGAGFGWLAMVNTKFVVVPPPGAGFVTVTFTPPTAEMSEESIEAVSFVALTNVVVLAAPLKFTTEVGTKLVPLTVSVKPAPPAVAPFGLSEVMVGAGLFIANGEFPDVPPPGGGFVTVTLIEPAVTRSPAVIAAVTCVALTNVVVLGFPLKFTTEPEINFVPFTVNVNPAPPTIALAGERVVIVGNGLFTANGEFPDVPPPGAGFVTVTLKDPAVAMSATVIAAVTCVAFTNVVVLLLPLKLTVAPLTKPVPFTVNVKAAPPAVALAGEIDVIAGSGLFTANGEFPDVPPPGAGLVTVTLKDPAAAISAGVIAAVICVAFTNVVVLAVPLNFTDELATKPVPLTVSVKAGPPVAAVFGESEVIVGAGLFTVNGEVVDVPPPGAGLVTVTLNVPAVAMSGAAIEAVTCVAFTNVVVLAVPLKFTTEDELKFVPLTVNVKAAPPANVLVGESDVSVGNGLFTVNGEFPEVPPPGAGFVTVTLKVPAVAMSPARIAAVTCVEFTNVVVLATPLKFTVAPVTNPVPLTVSVNPAPPAIALVGAIVVMTGGGFVTGRLTVPEVPPPGAGLVTESGSDPSAAMSPVVT